MYSSQKLKIVFFNNSAILFGGPAVDPGTVKTIYLYDKSQIIRFLESFFKVEQTNDILIQGYDSKTLFKDFKKYFKFVKAAGGLVQNEYGNYLFIRRLGVWDLPKGKLEKRESTEECAVREVEEETGISQPFVKKKLKSTYHIYLHKNNFILKKTHWFLMEVAAECQLKPQQEEDITDVKWLTSKQSRSALKHSYRSLNDILSPYILD